MGLKHSTRLAYGFEIPANTDLEEIDRALGGAPDDDPDAVGYAVIGDWDAALLCTRHTVIAKNTVLRLTPDVLAPSEVLAKWEAALHDVAVRLGYADHPAPAWLVVHNYR